MSDPFFEFTRLDGYIEKIMATLLQDQNGALDLPLPKKRNAVPLSQAQRLCRIMRLAVIFASRRDETLPAILLRSNNNELGVVLPQGLSGTVSAAR